jgi:hypothetical protein
MGYVHSSPWQDAANMGSSIGDRLAQALIELPLQKARINQQLLAQRAALSQQGFENRLAVRRSDTAQDVATERERHDRAVEPSPYKGQVDQLGSEIKLQSQENARTSKSIDDLTKFDIADDTKRMDINQRAQSAHERMLNSTKPLDEPHEELFGMSIKEAMGIVSGRVNNTSLSPEQKDSLAKTIPLIFNRVKAGAAQEQGGGQQAPAAPAGQPTSKRFSYDPASGQLIPQ